MSTALKIICVLLAALSLPGILVTLFAGTITVNLLWFLAKKVLRSDS